MNKHIDKSLEELKNLPRSEAKTKQKIQSNALRSQLAPKGPGGYVHVCIYIYIKKGHHRGIGRAI